VEAGPLDYLKRKLAGAQSGHHDATTLGQCIGLVVTPAARRDN